MDKMQKFVVQVIMVLILSIFAFLLLNQHVRNPRLLDFAKFTVVVIAFGGLSQAIPDK